MAERGDGLRTTAIVIAFEGGLGIVAIIVSWLAGHALPFGGGGANAAWVAAGIGLIATFPLLVGLFALERLPWKSLRRLEARVRTMIRQVFAGASVVQLLLISIAAGFGEELLFRGLIQAGLADWMGEGSGTWIALVLASLVFGVCHWLDATYAVLASLAGVYFGFLLIVTNNLWTPIVAHAAYDFLALLYLTRSNDLVKCSVEV